MGLAKRFLEGWLIGSKVPGEPFEALEMKPAAALDRLISCRKLFFPPPGQVSQTCEVRRAPTL